MSHSQNATASEWDTTTTGWLTSLRVLSAGLPSGVVPAVLPLLWSGRNSGTGVGDLESPQVVRFGERHAVQLLVGVAAFLGFRRAHVEAAGRDECQLHANRVLPGRRPGERIGPRLLGGLGGVGIDRAFQRDGRRPGRGLLQRGQPLGERTGLVSGALQLGFQTLVALGQSGGLQFGLARGVLGKLQRFAGGGGLRLGGGQTLRLRVVLALEFGVLRLLRRQVADGAA